jgi:putative tryptophan/tyrosine transport system substrate-binding protein
LKLHELVPAATPIGFFVNPTNRIVFEAELMEAETASRALGVRLVTLNASNLTEIEAAFEIVIEQRIGALLTSGDPLWTVRRAALAELTARHAVPAIHAVRDIVDAGGLVSYGASIADAYRLVDRL